MYVLSLIQIGHPDANRVLLLGVTMLTDCVPTDWWFSITRYFIVPQNENENVNVFSVKKKKKKKRERENGCTIFNLFTAPSILKNDALLSQEDVL